MQNLSQQRFDEIEYSERCREHILWGLSQAVDDDDVPEITKGTVAELSRLTGIPYVRLTRRLKSPKALVPASYKHREGDSLVELGGILFYAWEYLACCYCLGISTNPYVRTKKDPSNGFFASDIVEKGVWDAE